MNAHSSLPPHLGTLGFSRNPFPQTPDADCHFRTDGIKRQFTEALHCVEAGKGFVLLTGEVGTGKSTFLRCLMDELIAKQCVVAFVFNTFLQGRELLLAINRDFGLAPGADLADDIDRLNRFLIDSHAEGRTCVVVIDDAQNLDAASLELLRLLSNLETRQNKLLQIVLSGQPELLDVLATPGFRQLASRIVQHVRLAPLDRGECARYVDFRIARAGSDGRIGLTPAAHRAVHAHSHGNPRRVHLIMDRCLYGVMPTEKREIGRKLVDTAAAEVGIVTGVRHSRANWIVTGILGLGFGLVAWSATRAPQPDTLTAPATQAVAPIVAARPLEAVAPVSAPAATSMPAAAASAPVLPPASPVAALRQLPEQPLPALDGCLQRIGAAKWLPLLQDGLNTGTQLAIERSLAQEGFALTGRPPASGLASAPAAAITGACLWENRVGAWALWRPAYAPFDLRTGTQGEAVRWLQIRLAEAGRYSGAIDGVVGRQTLDAFAAFRRDNGLRNGLAEDGSVDASALFLLEHADARARPAAPVRQGEG
jgi:general secretion pathway protein A